MKIKLQFSCNNNTEINFLPAMSKCTGQSELGYSMQWHFRAIVLYCISTCIVFQSIIILRHTIE